MDIKSLRICDIVTTKNPMLTCSNGSYYEIVRIDGTNNYTSSNGVKHVGCVSLEPIKEAPYIGGAWVDYLEPIPITHELLVHLGFTMLKHIHEYHGVEITCNIDSYNYTFCYPEYDHYVSKCIKYLHELQHEMFDAGIDFEIKI